MVVTTLAGDERSALSDVASAATGWALDHPTLETLRRAAWRSEVLGGLGTRVRRELDRSGYCLVHDVPTASDAELATFLGLVSTLSTEGNGGELFFSITPAADDDEPADVSRTTAAFPFHSDSTYLLSPHEMLGLGCVVNDSAGGDSSLLLARDVAARVEEKAGRDALLALADPVFPFFLRDAVAGYGVQRVPLLRQVGEEWHVRYRADVLETLVARHGPGEPHRTALDVFRSVVDDPGDAGIILRLRPGDYLLIDNRRTLHSRTALGEGARELRRSKGYFLHGSDRSIL